MEKEYTISVPKDSPNFRRTFIISFLLDSEFKNFNNQYKRICEGKRIKRAKHLAILFGDIRFFLITAGNIKKMLIALSDIFSDDRELKNVLSKYSDLLEILMSLRSHHEHILEGRLEGKGKYGKEDLIEPNVLGDLSNDIYNFGGEKINLSDAHRDVNKLFEDLAVWNRKSKVNPLW